MELRIKKIQKKERMSMGKKLGGINYNEKT